MLRTIGTSVAQRQNASDFVLLKHRSPYFGETDTCALTQLISQDHGDRQTKKRTEPNIRTNRRTSRHTDRRALGQKRGKTDKAKRSRRQQTRFKRQDGRQSRWCGMVHTATRGWVVVWWSCCVVVRVVCLCLSCWGSSSGGRLSSPPVRWQFAISSLEVTATPLLNWPRHQGCPRQLGNTREQVWASRGATLVCSTFFHYKLS